MLFKDNKKDSLNDILVGMIIGLVSIPISMGYAMVAGLSPVYGLYGSIVPVLVFSLITSSPRFVFGVDAAPAALVSGILSQLAITPTGSDAAMVVPVITLITAVWLFIFTILRADRLLKFISHPVMGGFITGIGLTIITMQFPKLYGKSAGTGEIAELVVHAVKEASDGFHLLSFILGILSIAIILISKKLFPKFPIQAAVMFIGAGLTYFFHVDEKEVALLPKVASGFPKPMLPDISTTVEYGTKLLIPAFSIAVVIFTESLLASSNIGMKYDERINRRREIAAYASGNLAAAFFGVCPVNGSVSRTGIADQYKVKSQIMSLSACILMGAVVIWGTGFISLLPVPVLTAIVISALIGTLEFDLAAKLKKADREEFIIFIAVMAAVLVFGTVTGVITGILLAQVTFIIRASKPRTELLGIIEGNDGFFDLNGRMGNAVPLKDVVIYRFSGSLFYANIEQFCSGLMENVKEETKIVIVESSGIVSVDMSAATGLINLYEKIKKSGKAFYLAGHVSHVNDQLYELGAGALIDEGVVRSRISLALRAQGLERPYETEPGYVSNAKPFAKKFAEFSWAYGNRSQEKMKQLVRQVAEEIALREDFDPSDIRKEEREFAKGYWNYADEAMFLEELELELTLMAIEGKISGEKEDDLSEKITSRRFQIGRRLEGQDKSYRKKLSLKISEREKEFEKKYPKAYELLLKERNKTGKP